MSREKIHEPYDDSSYPTNSDPTNHETLNPTKTYTLRFDGGSRSNPGISGAGMVLYDDRNREIRSQTHFVGTKATNNEAEYTALLKGLEWAIQLGVCKIVAEGDSLLVVKQLRGDYKCKSENLIPLYDAVRNLREEFRSFEVNYIPRKDNARADELANAAMDEFECLMEGGGTASMSHVEHESVEESSSQSHSKVESEQSNTHKSSNLDIDISPNKTYLLRFNGRVRGNIIAAGAGMVFYDDQHREIWSGTSFTKSKVTKNEAEYSSLLKGLEYARTLGIRKIVVEGDSLLVTKQLRGDYKCKSENLVRLYGAVQDLRNEFESFEVNRISQKSNKRAGELAKLAMETPDKPPPDYS